MHRRSKEDWGTQVKETQSVLYRLPTNARNIHFAFVIYHKSCYITFIYIIQEHSEQDEESAKTDGCIRIQCTLNSFLQEDGNGLVWTKTNTMSALQKYEYYCCHNKEEVFHWKINRRWCNWEYD